MKEVPALVVQPTTSLRPLVRARLRPADRREAGGHNIRGTSIAQRGLMLDMLRDSSSTPMPSSRTSGLESPTSNYLIWPRISPFGLADVWMFA
jgi:hypothetical protein